MKASSQFYVGLETGINKNKLITNNSSQSFTTYNPATGFSIGVPVAYQFSDWLAIQADLNYTQKNYEIKRTGFFQGIYQQNRNAYLQLPVMGHFSFGGEQLRGFVNLGMVAGYWLSSRVKGVAPNILNAVDTAYFTVNPNNILEENNGYAYNQKYQFNSTRDQRWELGWVAGIGISYETNSGMRFFGEGRLTSGFTDQQKHYQTNQTPRYNDTYGISIGCMLLLGTKNAGPGF